MSALRATDIIRGMQEGRGWAIIYFYLIDDPEQFLNAFEEANPGLLEAYEHELERLDTLGRARLLATLIKTGIANKFQYTHIPLGSNEIAADVVRRLALIKSMADKINRV